MGVNECSCFFHCHDCKGWDPLGNKSLFSKPIPHQWQIQDFPWGVPTPEAVMFFVCQNERIWTFGGQVPGMPPRSANVHSRMSVVDPGFPIGGCGPCRGAMDSRGSYISKILYVKMKESGPVGGVHWACPLDLPMECVLHH